MIYGKLKFDPTPWHFLFANPSNLDFVNLYFSSPNLSVSGKPNTIPLGKKPFKNNKCIKHLFHQSKNYKRCDYFGIKGFKKSTRFAQSTLKPLFNIQ